MSSPFPAARLRPLGIHDGVWMDEACADALALREELLRFPRWAEMRTNSGVLYERQCGITTGEIAAGDPPELGRCWEFSRSLVAGAGELFPVAGSRREGPVRLQAHGMAYGQGAWLLRHTDEPGAGVERLSWILFLTDPAEAEWTDADGGELVCSDDASREVSVRPRFNRFVLFRNSAGSHHEVGEVRRPTAWATSRLTLSGWLFS